MKINLDKLFDIKPYSLDSKTKGNLLNKYLFELTQLHYTNCKEYKRMLDALGFKIKKKHHFSLIPFLPVRLFKLHELFSIPKTQIIKTMTSSGTSGQEVSKIFLDKKTAFYQSKTLTKIISTYLGSVRSPMIIIDSSSVLKDRNMFSARGAGILGFSIFGSKRFYALDDKMELKVDELSSFIKNHQNERIFIFGFTFMIYKYFLEKLKERKINIDLANSVLIHGGGWKKLESESISSAKFKDMLDNHLGMKFVHDYYGMVEQTGSIFMECEKGYMHASNFSDVIIRRPKDFKIANLGEAGIIQTLSVLPLSYPGHSLLTEDEGVLLGEDNCKCGRLGKYFRIFGRLKNAELRGCSDTHAASI